MQPEKKESKTSKENVDTAVTDTVTASTAMDSEALLATAGATPPRLVRGSPSIKGRSSKDKKKTRSQGKGSKQSSVLSRAHSRAKVQASKLNGSRSVDGKKAKAPMSSLPAPPPAPAPAKPKKVDKDVPAGPAMSSPSATESLVTFSKDASNDELHLPPLPSTAPNSSSKKTSSLPKEAASSRNTSKRTSTTTPSKQAVSTGGTTKDSGSRPSAASTLSSRPSTRPFQVSGTSSLATGRSQDGSSVSPETKDRDESDPYETAPFMDVLVENMKEVAHNLGRRLSWQVEDLEEASLFGLPSGHGTRSRDQPATAPAKPSGRSSVARKPNAPEGGLDVISFTVATGASSMLLIVLLYLLKGLRSPAFNCTEPHNCSNSSAPYAPHY